MCPTHFSCTYMFISVIILCLFNWWLLKSLLSAYQTTLLLENNNFGLWPSCTDPFITPNMHMHCHLRQVVDDYGPIFGIWLFSFEQYNESLSSQTHNNRAIEYQLLSRFVQDNFVHSYNFPQLFHDDFQSVCSVDKLTIGSLHDTSFDCSSDTI